MAGFNKSIKKANRKATKGRGIRWKKGQSSNFNPECKKHRLEAKRRAVFENRGVGSLTEAKLAQHNKLTSENLCPDEEEMSVGGETAVTGFTTCSLPTFSGFLKNWHGKSLLENQMVAVLAAVTELLKSEGKKETDTAYFANLMILLDKEDADEGITAVIRLLSMTVKRLNESVLKLNCQPACEKFIKLLLKYMNTEHAALLKDLLIIVFIFLKVKTQWTEPSDELNVLLEFSTHHKPKVRKVAHSIIRRLLIDHVPNNSTIHPGAVTVANFCVEKLVKIGGLAASRDVFYILTLLQETISFFPKSSVQKVCETVFRLMNLSSSMVTSCCLKTLQGLFNKQAKSANVPVDLNGRIITALYDFQPNVKDSQCLTKWLELMEAAFINIQSLDSQICLAHLPKFFSVAIKCWQNDNDMVLQTVASTLNTLLHQCLQPESIAFQQLLTTDLVNNPIHEMFRQVEGALIYQYHKAWKYVISVLAGFFEVVGKYYYTVMEKCLIQLANMHDSYKFPCIQELERCIGVAVEYIGPRIVLKAIPLLIGGESDRPDFPRSWLLPLLRDHIKKTELSFFIEYFLPLAGKLRNKVLVLQQEEKIIESKLYDVICSQIWSLLPGFCTEPTDLKQCFKEVAQVLGMILRDEPSLRMTILSSLRLLVSKNVENVENKEVLARFSKNYLPILFNLYTTEPKDKAEEKVRLAVYETCKIYLQITDKELCDTFFVKAVEKLHTSESDIFMRHALIDLCKAMSSYVSNVRIEQLYEYCKPLLTHSNPTIQKKSFSVIKELCTSKSESSQAFVKAHLEDVRALLCETVSGLNPSTKALRLNCLQHILSELAETEKDCIPAIIPQAVLSTKESSQKARIAAYSLLVEIGHTLKRWNPDDQKGALRDYMTMLLAGLGGSPHMMSSTILAIGRIMYEFKDELDSDIIHLLIENMCLLITSQSREVVISALSFLKILFSTVDTLTLAQHVEFMVKSMTTVAEDNQRHFRFKAREVFTRLIRKFGYEMISKLAPDNCQKQLSHIRKMEARKRRKRNLQEEESDSEVLISNKKSDEFEDIMADSDDEVQNSGNVRKLSKKFKRNADPYIEEDGENDIVDFMDPAVNKKLLTMKPEQNVSNKKTTNSFPISEDGRMIIQEEEDTELKSERGVKTDERAGVMTELGINTKKNKRKFEDDSDEDNEVQADSAVVKKGIHRTLRKAKTDPGSKFKAKKAGGDVKKGKLDPYAYIPFNRMALNKRKQMKIKGQFKNFVNAAKRGANVGLKRKSREAKRRN